MSIELARGDCIRIVIGAVEQHLSTTLPTMTYTISSSYLAFIARSHLCVLLNPTTNMNRVSSH